MYINIYIYNSSKYLYNIVDNVLKEGYLFFF